MLPCLLRRGKSRGIPRSRDGGEPGGLEDAGDGVAAVATVGSSGAVAAAMGRGNTLSKALRRVQAGPRKLAARLRGRCGRPFPVGGGGGIHPGRGRGRQRGRAAVGPALSDASGARAGVARGPVGREVWEEPRLRGAVAVTVGCVVAAGLALQVLGLRFVRYSLDSLRAVEDVLRSTRYEVVATGFEPMFRSQGGLYFQKKLMAVDSQEELRSLVRRLAERRVAGWTYVPRFGRGFDARTVEEWTRESPWRFRVVEDRTPMAVRFVGVGEFRLELRLVTYQGFPAPVPGAGAPPW